MLDKCEAADVEGPDVVDMAMNLVSIVQTEFEPTEFESEFDLPTRSDLPTPTRSDLPPPTRSDSHGPSPKKARVLTDEELEAMTE